MDQVYQSWGPETPDIPADAFKDVDPSRIVDRLLKLSGVEVETFDGSLNDLLELGRIALYS